MNLSSGFKIVMLRYGVSVVQLAKKRGVSCRAISKVIGTGTVKKMDTIKSYCDDIGCTLTELMEEAEKVKSK